jgi:uncharacterized protein
MSERMCIVTRASGPTEGLIRFVAAPDGTVVPDLKERLPGRGCWITPERDIVALALKRRLFAKALKAEVTVDPDMPEMLDRLLRDQLLGMMAMARKAGQFVSGATKVDKAVRSGEALAVFHATDAAEDGVRKIGQARHFAIEVGLDPIEAFHLLSADEMAFHLGEGALIHAAALAGQAGEGVVKRAKLLHRYRHGLAKPSDGALNGGTEYGELE